MLRREGIEGSIRYPHLRGRFGHPFVPGNELRPAAAFNRAASLLRMTEKILK